MRPSQLSSLSGSPFAVFSSFLLSRAATSCPNVSILIKGVLSSGDTAWQSSVDDECFRDCRALGDGIEMKDGDLDPCTKGGIEDLLSPISKIVGECRWPAETIDCGLQGGRGPWRCRKDRWRSLSDLAKEGMPA